MKQTLRWAWPIVAVALAIGLPWACYKGRPAVPLRLVVLDKTVPFQNWIEHRSLFWLVNHLNIVRPDGSPYDARTDYYGAHPPVIAGEPPARTADLARRDVEGAALVYLADTYGVYRDDLKSGPKMLAALERSPVVYGGLTENEAAAVATYVERGGTLVAEFNTMGSPTPESARQILEYTLGARWTRWIGRYFPRLEDPEEVPRWLVRNWEAEWERPWIFEGPGYVLVQDDAHVEVLRIGEESKRIGLVIEREQPVDPLLEDAADGIPYPYWFDVVEPRTGTTVLASFRWDLEPSGLERLEARGLPRRFPAVLRRQEPGGGRSFYFAGDFADNPMDTAEVPFSGYLAFRRGAEAIKLAPSESAFFWRFYAPMMKVLIADASHRAGA